MRLEKTLPDTIIHSSVNLLVKTPPDTIIHFLEPLPVLRPLSATLIHSLALRQVVLTVAASQMFSSESKQEIIIAAAMVTLLLVLTAGSRTLSKITTPSSAPMRTVRLTSRTLQL